MWLHTTKKWYTLKQTGNKIVPRTFCEVDDMSEWNKLIPKPKSRFLVVRCTNCENEQIIFDHAVHKVTCNVCSTELAESSGGKAIIKGKIVTSFE